MISGVGGAVALTRLDPAPRRAWISVGEGGLRRRSDAVLGAGAASYPPTPVFKMSRKLVQRQAIEHPGLGHTPFARHLNPPMGEINFRRGMRVRVDAHQASELQRALMPAPIKIEAPRICIDLD